MRKNFRASRKQIALITRLNMETINTPIRKKIAMYSLSDLGKEVFRKKEGSFPPKDEMTRIREMHATLPHGFCIKDTASVLNGLGYTDICMDSTQNSVTVADGRRYVPDITATFDGKKTYWEVELGHHHDNDMADKLAKASLVAKTVYIVVDKKETKTKLQQQVNFFRKQSIKNRTKLDFIVYVGTLNELQDKVYLTLPENRIDLRSGKSDGSRRKNEKKAP